jgi:hypothetical protein
MVGKRTHWLFSLRVTVELDQPCLHVHPERRSVRRSYRSLLVVATSALAGLTATGPALAADEPPAVPPPVTVPEVADIAPPAIPIPETPPVELSEPPLDVMPEVVTHIDPENIDVSIRILSPGEDGAVAQESETAVVSPASEADITETIDEVEPADAAGPESSGAVNTNVSIRVLSPGDRGEVAQSGAGGGEEDVEAEAGSPSPRTDAASASTPPATDSRTAERYQDNNSQYQSEDDSWNWRWNLSVDCTGNATSSSTETGRQESLIWFWEWTWEWGCAEAPVVEPNGSNAPSSSPTDVAKPPGQEAITSDTAEAAADPWSWNWTFTFCGETRTVATRTGAGTPLIWSWDWSWTWSCGSAAEDDVAAPAPPAVVVPPVAEPPQRSEDSEESEDDSTRSLYVADEPATEMLSSAWFPSFTMTGGRGAVTTFVWPSMPEPPLELTVEVAIPPVVLPVPTAPPLTSPAIPFPASGVPAEPTSVPPPAPPTMRPSPGAVLPPESAWNARPEVAARGAHARAHDARPAKHAGAKSRRAHRSPAPFLPFERRQPRQVAGSSNAGGFVPSALLLGVAALTGFIFVAAPGLGRRIQVARELSPRGLEQSPLDRPG